MALVAGDVRYLDESVDVDDLFLFEAGRRVMDGRILSLHGRLYEVDPLLVDLTVASHAVDDSPRRAASLMDAPRPAPLRVPRAAQIPEPRSAFKTTPCPCL